MCHYEMDPPTVHGSGQQVTGLVDGAAGLARRYLASLETSRGEVRHPTVQGALDRYRDTWQQPVQDVAREIDSLGGNPPTSQQIGRAHV